MVIKKASNGGEVLIKTQQLVKICDEFNCSMFKPVTCIFAQKMKFNCMTRFTYMCY